MADETILEEAQRLVYGPRQQAYGHPADDFARTGRIWGALLAEWAKSGEAAVPPELVGLCMVGVKLSREVNAPARDNLTDAAGYAATVAMIRERQAAGEAIHVESLTNLNRESVALTIVHSVKCRGCDRVARAKNEGDHLNIDEIEGWYFDSDRSWRCPSCAPDAGERQAPRCTGDPCICTNGIGCVTVPVDEW